MFKRNWFGIVGVLSVILLAVAIFYRPAPDLPDVEPEQRSAEEDLEYFMHDRMNYGIHFSVVLAEKRIERATLIAQAYPGLEVRALEVIDSLRNRLARKAVID